MKFRVTVFILLFSVAYASAQRCGTEEYLMRNTNDLTESLLTPLTASSGRDTLKNEVIVIPVVVHLLFNNNTQNISDAQVLSQIDALNKDYRRLNADADETPIPFQNVAADTRIVFCLAKVDPNGRYTSGIIRKYTKEQFWLSDDEMKFSSKGGDDSWNSKKYLNIWVCNLFGRTLGYSVLPGGPADKDGVVIQYDVFGTTGTLNAQFNKGRTATHEIGHWLGLKHLWGDASCGNDGISDTPPQQSNNSYCPSFPRTSSCSINSFGDMFMNYMDFTDDACMNLFTAGQKNVMRGLFASGNARNSFLTSNVCDSSQAQAGPLPVDTSQYKVSITVYPNPFTNEIIIKSENSGDLIGKKIKLYDVTGKLFVTQILQSQKTIIPLSQLPGGIYFIKIEGTKISGVYKVVKQNNYSK
ncbi:MAG: M43 family zinc metalloprotease [Ginsengibacter sp.]